MVTLASLLAVALYLVPIVALLAMRSRRDRELWEIALDIPLAVALDLLGVLLLARLVPLQMATLASRPAWIAVAAAILIARRRRGHSRPAWPIALGRREVLLVAVAAAAAVLVSLTLSRPYSIWDRGWHTALVASIRGQTVPFMNVFEQHGGLHYHFSGDVLAAMMQALSFSVIHSSLGLSIAHDVMFGLLGVSLALLLWSFGHRRIAVITLAMLGVLLSGPHTVLRGGLERPVGAYSFLSFLVMSYRPHVSLAGLLLVGFTGPVLVRLRLSGAPLPLVKTAPVLLASTALLGITDEASIGVLGIALGAAWLAEPDVIHPKRAYGLAVFAGLVIALAAPNLLFSAALSPGAHSLELSIVPWRSPGYHKAALPLSSSLGRRQLFLDLAPMLAVLLAGLLRIPWKRDRGFVASIVFFEVLLVVSAALLTRVSVGGVAEESHRFMTAVSFLAPLFGLCWLGPFRPAEGRPSRSETLGPLLVIGSMALGAVSTLEWVQALAPIHAFGHDVFDARRRLYDVNCRADAGADLSRAPRPTYVASSIWYLYVGCEPVFYPAESSHQRWTLNTGPAKTGYGAFFHIHGRMLEPSDSMDVVCPLSASEAIMDPVCARVLPRAACEPIGRQAVRCTLSPAQRVEAILIAPPLPTSRRR